MAFTTWLKPMLGQQSMFRAIDLRAVTPDSKQFYEVHLQAHLGMTRTVHKRPPTMQKVLHECFVLGPSKAFYNV